MFGYKLALATAATTHDTAVLILDYCRTQFNEINTDNSIGTLS